MLCFCVLLCFCIIMYVCILWNGRMALAEFQTSNQLINQSNHLLSLVVFIIGYNCYCELYRGDPPLATIPLSTSYHPDTVIVNKGAFMADPTIVYAFIQRQCNSKLKGLYYVIDIYISCNEILTCPFISTLLVNASLAR